MGRRATERDLGSIKARLQAPAWDARLAELKEDASDSDASSVHPEDHTEASIPAEDRAPARRTRHDADPSAAHRAIREAALAAYEGIAPAVERLRGQGSSYQEVAASLNAAGFRTRRGAAFDHGTVRRIYLRAQSWRREVASDAPEARRES